MGSLFLAVIPTRSFEFQLRLIENDIYNTQVTPISAVECETPEAFLKMFKEDVPVVLNEEGDENLLKAKDVLLPANKDVVEAYRMKKDGERMILQVNRDRMKLLYLTSLRETEIIEVVSTHSLHTLAYSDFESVVAGPSSRRRRNSEPKIEDTQLSELINNQFLEKHMEEALTKFALLNASWERSIDEKFSTIMFAVKVDRADEIINHLQYVGIGKKYQSTLSVSSCSVFAHEGQTTSEDVEEATGNNWSDFVASIKARLTVAQVVQNVRANALMTFDFIIMVIVAAIISAMGLLDNSPINLIASMLVSPLMGPIMAFTFGAMIHDWSLVKAGVRSELWGLFICMVVGFVVGIVVQYQPTKGPWEGVKQWPTPEMYSRSQTRALAIGAAIAIPSGAGVALSILAGNSGSLVGVAISASLLPPCVNCGVFYGMTFAIACQEWSYGHNPFNFSCDSELAMSQMGNTSESNPILYCRNALIEYAIMGSVSLSLTLLNILLIFLTGLVALKIKEVAPYTSKKAFERFWKHDLREARDFNKKHIGRTDALLDDIDVAENPRLLNVVEEDFVFNQVKNRLMIPEENIIDRVKYGKRVRSETGTAKSGGLFNWLKITELFKDEQLRNKDPEWKEGD